MGRMTQKEASGVWQVKGIPWERLRQGVVLTKGESETLYGCLYKLKDYEETGMSPDQVADLQHDLEAMAGRVCDEVCRYRREITEQEGLDETCAVCPVSALISYITSEGGIVRW